MSRGAQAAAIFAVDPFSLGVLLRARPGPARDRFCAMVRAALPPGAPVVRLPVHADEARLLGAIDLAATLQLGKLVERKGLLAEAHGGALFASMAERLDPSVAMHLCAALDRGEIAVEREGIAGSRPARIGIVALDEGIDDERVAPALQERLALHVELGEELEADPDFVQIAAARQRYPSVTIDGESIAALCAAAAELGIASVRAPMHAAAAARAAAALAGRSSVAEEDAALAAQLVLGPRATRVPAEPEEENEPEPDQPAGDEAASGDEESAGSLDEIVLAAAKAALPAGLLAQLSGAQTKARKSAGKSGAVRNSGDRGRPAGVRAAQPRPGQRLNLIETLRAAAPWQRIRRRERASGRVEVRAQDFRVSCRRQPAETLVIFAVDTSGSSAAQRLAEAKGAVEQVLAECYARRDSVALISFRGRQAALLLPPTRSLARARRTLAGIPGGGGTPLAAGIDAAQNLATDALRKGQTPLLVVMSDGRANVARDGAPDRARAEADAKSAARAVRACGFAALFLDTAPRARPESKALASAMGANYLALPFADSRSIERNIRALAGAR